LLSGAAEGGAEPGTARAEAPNSSALLHLSLRRYGCSRKITVIVAETHIVPGLGIVYTASVQSIPQYQTAIRIETRLTSMKLGSGPEPEIGKYTSLLDK